jgi:SpoVK/Ycf46/Vps4 family AAA+-type ATPase
VLLVTENLSELHPKLVGNPKTATLKIPMPDEAERAAVIRLANPKLEAKWVERLAEVTAGLKSVQIKTLLEPAPEGGGDPAERERFIRALLGDAPNADERARRFAQVTAGMTPDEIKALVNPAASTPQTDAQAAERDELMRLIFKRKREIIERECFGLIEFVTPSHDFSVVGGIDEVKHDLLAIARNIREGKTQRCPMGILFTGPMGTGKTFVAEAFVKEAGLTAIKFKNFRSKWVGATEGNLEKILSVVQAIGQVIVIIDEGDRAFGGGGESGESDGGTSSRVIARIKEFMSDTDNRGRVLFILMTNRPDKLDIDIKRAGRLDRKIPFLYPQEAEDVEQVLAAQIRKHRLQTTAAFPRDREAVSARLVGYSNADLEAVVLLAADYAQEAPVTVENLVAAVADYLPSRDDEMLQYMELIAVFEASNRRMLPRKYAELPVEELQARMNLLKLKVGSRR